MALGSLQSSNLIQYPTYNQKKQQTCDQSSVPHLLSLVPRVPGTKLPTYNQKKKNDNKQQTNKNSRSTHVYVTVPHDPAQLLSHLPLWMQPAATKRETGDTMEGDVSKLHTVVAATLLGCVMPTV